MKIKMLLIFFAVLMMQCNLFSRCLVAQGDFFERDKFAFRFSSKYLDSETGDYYYGYRYYNADTGRWLGRDPIGENGGKDLYAMVSNNLIIYFDKYGLSIYGPSN